MIPPASNASFGARRARDVMHAGPSASHHAVGSAMESDAAFPECVLDLSKYLNSTDLPSSPQQFFDDLFDEEKPGPGKHMLGLFKIKEEPDSAATSRCSTPESLLPEHDYDHGDFPSPQFQISAQNMPRSSFVLNNNRLNLKCQLQSLNSSSATTDVDSESESSDSDSNGNPLPIDPYRLKSALDVLGTRYGDANTAPLSPSAVKVEETDRSSKAPRSKHRKLLAKGTPEYVIKRERNNVAVRKSRTKAKLKHIETQMRVGELTEENNQLKNRISALQKELNALKSFIAYNSSSLRKPPGSSSYPPAFSG